MNYYQRESNLMIRDWGPQAGVLPLALLAQKNGNYRAAVWTGEHLQMTVMTIPVGGDIGLEQHGSLDQMLYVVCGTGLVQYGDCPQRLCTQQRAGVGCAVMVPAGTWHNVRNIGSEPLRLFSVYAPVQHPYGTVHKTKADAQAQESHAHAPMM